MSSLLHVDPSLRQLGQDDIVPIDPSLFQLEEVVNEVRRGKVKLDEHHPAPSTSTTNQPLGETRHDEGIEGDEHGGLDDDDIDPALREIVNSLTNAQQSSQVGPGLTHAQAAAAIGAHLTDSEERERLQQSLQNTLDDLTQASFGSLFPSNFPQSPTSSFLLPQPVDGPSNSNELGQGSASPSNADSGNPDTNSNSEARAKRGRGRPKGSKNKPKLHRPPRPPKPPKPPSRPRGRPPKTRSEEEQADYEQRRQERALGIKRKKGRPRKFPGYLVREMRLKKNRAEFNELKQRQDQGLEIEGMDLNMEDVENAQEYDGDHKEGDHGEQEEIGENGHDRENGQVYAWSHEDQSLLDVVGAAHLRDHERGNEMDVDVGGEGDGETPSGLGKGDEGMREVFGLSGQILGPS